MFNNFLNALEDYIDLRIEQSQDNEEHSGRWHEHMRERTRDITRRMQDAFTDAVENLIPSRDNNDY